MTSLTAQGRALTSPEFQRLAAVPPGALWFAKGIKAGRLAYFPRNLLIAVSLPLTDELYVSSSSAAAAYGRWRDDHNKLTDSLI